MFVVLRMTLHFSFQRLHWPVFAFVGLLQWVHHIRLFLNLVFVLSYFSTENLEDETLKIKIKKRIYKWRPGMFTLYCILLVLSVYFSGSIL